MNTRLFLDTEFVQAPRGPVLLSMGIVAENIGAQLYMELPPSEVQAIPLRRLTSFLSAEVLPQFGRIAAAEVARKDMPARLASWLSSLGAIQAEVIYDFNVDYLLLEQLMDAIETSLSIQLIPTHVGYLLEDPGGEAAALASWEQSSSDLGIRRHHALADALALVARFEAVHGRSG